MNTEFNELVRDDWLGDQLGKPAWHLKSNANPKQGILSTTAPAFIDARATPNDTEYCRELFSAGFNLVNTTITLGRTNHGQTSNSAFEVRQAELEDAPSIEEIAAKVFTFDRFHADPDIPNETANRIKASWAKNYFSGQRGDWMIVGRIKGKVSGFLQLLKNEPYIVIDLIGVDKNARGTGLAAEMIGYSTAICEPNAPMRVGTQLTNTTSIRFYEALGFKIEDAYHVFHNHVIQ